MREVLLLLLLWSGGHCLSEIEIEIEIEIDRLGGTGISVHL